MSSSSSEEWTTVRTTIPCLPHSSSRPLITTSRLILRPFTPSDLDAVHALRRQPETMQWTSTGRIDADEQQTAKWLTQFLPPNDTSAFNCAICLKDGGELIGTGGVYRFHRDGPSDGGDGFGWPELGYLLGKEYWGKGMASEFLRGFLAMWEDLDREVVERRVKTSSLVGESLPEAVVVVVEERLVAITDTRNGASRRILEKCGFESFAAFEEEDIRDPERTIDLMAYTYLVPKAVVNE